jgi:hypothetical protein
MPTTIHRPPGQRQGRTPRMPGTQRPRIRTPVMICKRTRTLRTHRAATRPEHMRGMRATPRHLGAKILMRVIQRPRRALPRMQVIRSRPLRMRVMPRGRIRPRHTQGINRPSRRTQGTQPRRRQPRMRATGRRPLPRRTQGTQPRRRQPRTPGMHSRRPPPLTPGMHSRRPRRMRVTGSNAPWGMPATLPRAGRPWSTLR